MFVSNHGIICFGHIFFPAMSHYLAFNSLLMTETALCHSELYLCGVTKHNFVSPFISTLCKDLELMFKSSISQMSVDENGAWQKICLNVSLTPGDSCIPTLRLKSGISLYIVFRWKGIWLLRKNNKQWFANSFSFHWKIKFLLFLPNEMRAWIFQLFLASSMHMLFFFSSQLFSLE